MFKGDLLIPLDIFKKKRTTLTNNSDSIVSISNHALDLRKWIQFKIDAGEIVVSGGGSGTTDLGYTSSPINGTVTSSTGTSAIIPLGTTTNAGLLSPTDKTKLDAITSIVSNISNPTIDASNILTIPFTKDGVASTVTVDLSSLAVDVNVASATVNPTTYELTVTETDGSTHTVNLQTLINNAENQRLVLADNELSITKGDGTTILNTVSLPSTNIYNSDGTLTSNRVVDFSSNSLVFTGGDFAYDDPTHNVTFGDASAFSVSTINDITLEANGDLLIKSLPSVINTEVLSIDPITSIVSRTLVTDISPVQLVENGLTLDVNTIKLGGTLIQPTDINGTSTQPLTFTDLSQFAFNTGNTIGTAYTSFSSTNAASISAKLKVTSTSDAAVLGQLAIDADGITSLTQVDNADVAGLYLNSPTEAQLQSTSINGVRALGVNENATYATNLPTQTTETEVLFISSGDAIARGVLVGLPAITSMYDSDALAAAGGIAINQAYWAGPAHVEGAIHGTLKLRLI